MDRGSGGVRLNVPVARPVRYDCATVFADGERVDGTYATIVAAVRE
jgi:hypothetical protein